MLLSISMTVPLIYAWQTHSEDLWGFLYSFLITLTTGFFLSRAKPASMNLQIKESNFVVVLCWILFCVFSSLPYMFCGVFNFTDAMFESMSGFTTTGSSVLVNIELTSKTILLWRGLTQWMGGMGIVVLSLAILPFLGSHGYNLYKAETTGLSADKLMPRLQTTAKILWFVYVALSLVFILSLRMAGMNLFDSTLHTFAGISTGGFSPKAMGIAAYQSSAIDWIVTLMMFLGGINFFLHYRLVFFKDTSSLIRDRELLGYCLIIFVFASGMTWDLWQKGIHPIADSIRISVFSVINHVTTTGFTHQDYLSWPKFSQSILLACFLVGGCTGSTAGGPKVMRLIVLFKAAALELKRVLHPSAVVKLRVGNTPIKDEIVTQVWGFFAWYAIVLGISALALTALGMDITSSVSAALSCVGNVGPGFGTVGPYANYFLVPEAGKWILFFAMLAGRLELYTLLVLFTPNFWRK